jgi:hypothetical protein
MTNKIIVAIVAVLVVVAVPTLPAADLTTDRATLHLWRCC